MKKTMWLWIGLIGVIIVAGVAVWWLLNTTTKQETPSTSTSSSNMEDMNAAMDQPTTPDTTQNTAPPAAPAAQSGTIAVTIKDMAFAPAKITIKKGSTVVWTNQDSVGHNAVGDSAQAGGLPTTATLLSKGQTESFTFNAVGVFTYHCTPHPFMQGTVQVVE